MKANMIINIFISNIENSSIESMSNFVMKKFIRYIS